MKIDKGLIVGFALFVLILGGTALLESKHQKEYSNDCAIKTEERIVRGGSLSGLIEVGATVKILFGYYNCNEIKRGDIVAYDYSGSTEPIIKIIKAMSGDTFHLQKTDNGWNILVNGKILKNSENYSYVLDEKRSKMISLYENDYNGIIPEGVYLLLGNTASGSLDSTRFGLSGKKSIIAKVNYWPDK